MVKQKRIMESMIGTFYIGRSKKVELMEGWFGVLWMSLVLKEILKNILMFH